MPKRLTTNDWICKATKVHGNVYDYEQVDYINAHTPVMIRCLQHGHFAMRPNDHLNGQGCRECGIIRRNAKNTYTTTSFNERASSIHGGKYDYSLVEYTRFDTPVSIICPTHGIFNQRPNRHLYGDGCPSCAREMSGFDGYSLKYFDTHPADKNLPAILYIVEFSHKTNIDDVFIKVGITKHSVKTRYHYGYSDYNLLVLAEHHTTLFNAYVTEQRILSQLKSYKKAPQIKFGGHTECLSLEAYNSIKHTLASA